MGGGGGFLLEQYFMRRCTDGPRRRFWNPRIFVKGIPGGRHCTSLRGPTWLQLGTELRWRGGGQRVRGWVAGQGLVCWTLGQAPSSLGLVTAASRQVPGRSRSWREPRRGRGLCKGSEVGVSRHSTHSCRLPGGSGVTPPGVPSAWAVGCQGPPPTTCCLGRGRAHHCRNVSSASPRVPPPRVLPGPAAPSAGGTGRRGREQPRGPCELCSGEGLVPWGGGCDMVCGHHAHPELRFEGLNLNLALPPTAV